MRFPAAAIFVFAGALSILEADSAAPPSPVMANPAVAPAGTNAAPAAPSEATPSAADIQSLETRAKEGDAEAELDLSLHYYKGEGVPKDLSRAYDLSLEAAIQGNSPAAKNMAVLYAKGEGVHFNIGKSVAWMRKSAELGASEAQRLLGVFQCEHGAPGAPHNVYQGTEWLRKAALAGDSEAEARYGDNLMCGIGGPKDLEQGFAYLLRSRWPLANYLLAHAYATGLYVPVDPVRAWAWLQLAPQDNAKVKELAAKLRPQLDDAKIAQATALVPKLKNLRGQTAFDAPNLAAVFDNGASTTMKFEKPFDMIVIPLMVQGKGPFPFMLDTGCSTSLLSSKVAAQLGVTGGDPFALRGIGEKLELARIASDLSFAVPGLKIDHTSAIIIPDIPMDEYVGRRIDGVIGGELLKHLVVRIDYAKKELTLALPGKLSIDPKATSLPLEVNYYIPTVTATIGDSASGTASGSFIIDTGDDGAGNVARQFLDDNPQVKVRSAVMGGSAGYGGINWSRTARMPVAMGGFQFHDTFLDFAVNRVANANGSTGDIGAEVWRRFTVTLDYPGKKIFLEPNEHLAEPFTYLFSGAGIKANRPDYHTFTVFVIAPDSPAESVDLRVNDQITQVDGKPTQPMTLTDLAKVLRKEGTHELHVLRDGKDLVVQLPFIDALDHPDEAAKYRSSAPSSYFPKVATMAVEWNGQVKAFYPDALIFRSSGLKLGDAYTPYAMRRAVLALWDTGLFREVSLSAPKSEKITTVTIHLEACPLAKNVTLAGLQPQEEEKLRTKLISEAGKRISNHDIFEDEALIRSTLAPGNAAERTVTLAVACDDGEVLKQDVVIPKAGP